MMLTFLSKAVVNLNLFNVQNVSKLISPPPSMYENWPKRDQYIFKVITSSTLKHVFC